MLFGVIYGLSNTKNATVGSAVFAFIVLGAITSAITGIITIVYNAIANMFALPALSFWCFFLIIEVLWEVKAIRKIHKENVK